MLRNGFALIMALLTLWTYACAQDHDDGPAISITSPDTAHTYAYGTIKSHVLFWSKAQKLLIARVTFTDYEQNSGQGTEDTHDFRLPGVAFDEAKGVFTATSSKNEIIPVAHVKKVLFMKSVETLPNAAVRVLHPKGNVSVILEAISPNDPALQTTLSNSDGTHDVDLDKVIK